jgi:hypothetical protein
LVSCCLLISACGSEESSYTLPSDEWVLIESQPSPIYLRYTDGGTQRIFKSSDEPFEGVNPGQPVPAKYAYGSGVVGDTIVLGRVTSSYGQRERQIFVRFEVVAFDTAADAVRIRVIPPAND